MYQIIGKTLEGKEKLHLLSCESPFFCSWLSFFFLRSVFRDKKTTLSLDLFSSLILFGQLFRAKLTELFDFVNESGLMQDSC